MSQLDQANLRHILLFLEEYDQLNASWEQAEAFLHYLKRTVRTSFKLINRPYMQRLYEQFKERGEIDE